MILKPDKSINYDDIIALKNNRIRENSNLEYKQADSLNFVFSITKEKLDEPTKEKRIREFLKDISAFANGEGGDILYGIKCDEKEGDLPVEIVPFKEDNIDRLKRDLDQHIEKIKPRIPTPIIQEIEEPPLKIGDPPTKKYVLLIRIQQSWRSPHAIQQQSDSSFYFHKRTGVKTIQMNMEEIRESFVRSEGITEKIRHFHSKRLDFFRQISTRNILPFNLLPSNLLIIHIFPLISFFQNKMVDFNMLKKVDKNWYSGFGYNKEFTLDGMAVQGIDQKEYYHLLKVGSVEYIKSYGYDRYQDTYKDGLPEDGKFLLNLDQLDIALPKQIAKNVEFMHNKFALQGPYFIFISFLKINDLFPYVHDDRINKRNGSLFSKSQELVFPEIGLNDYSSSHSIAELAEKIRVSLDIIWNTFGRESSESFDSDGKCTPRFLEALERI